MTSPAWSIRDGRLWVEGVACSELAARFGTPLYVISESRLRTNARRLTAALAAAWPYGEARLLPSLKANPTLATRAILNEEGVGCDTFGETELVAALRAGVPGEQISVNGASKSERLIALAVASGARITLDSARELPVVEDAVFHELQAPPSTSLLSRSHVKTASTPTGLQCTIDTSQFGIAPRVIQASPPNPNSQ